MTGRNMTATNYRYGFNGKEKDANGLGSQTNYDYGFRIYNPEIAKFLSVDPLTSQYANLTPYQFASNTPISAIDLDGLESKIVMFRQDYWEDGTPLLKKIGEFELEENGAYGTGILTVIHDSKPVESGTITDYDANLVTNFSVYATTLRYQQIGEGGNKTGFEVQELEREESSYPIYTNLVPPELAIDLISGPAGKVSKVAKLSKSSKARQARNNSTRFQKLLSTYGSIKVASALYYARGTSLRKSLGLIAKDGFQAHHIFTVGMLKNNAFIQKAVKQGFDFNGEVNGMKIIAKLHTGKHPKSLIKGLESMIKRTRRIYPNKSAKEILEIAGQQFKNLVDQNPNKKINDFFKK